jgi:hypothetical protein
MQLHFILDYPESRQVLRIRTPFSVYMTDALLVTSVNLGLVLAPCQDLVNNNLAKHWVLTSDAHIECFLDHFDLSVENDQSPGTAPLGTTITF